MTSYRLFPSTDGPATATAYPTGSPYIAGVLWKVTQGGMWFEGYWWWVCPPPESGTDIQPTAPTKCALWSVGFPNTSGTVIPESVVTSGELTAGQWNFIPLPQPIPLAPGSTYVAAIACPGNFPNNQNQFGGAGAPYLGGIVNGPLVAFSDTAANSGTNPEPYGHAQGTFSVSGSDPATTIPMQGNHSDNNWVDVQVSDTAPAGYSGSYQLWPNKFDASPATAIDQATPFTLATEVRLSQQVTADAVWFFSMSAAASLPTWAGIYRISDQSLVAVQASPSWTKPDGTAAAAGTGRIRCAFPDGTVLAPGAYRVAVYNSAGGSGQWSPREYGYWKTGAGANGITNGPISAPGNADASNAYVFFNQPAQTPPFTDSSSQEPANGTFAETGPQFPYLAVDYQFPGTSDPSGAVAESFWVDLEVTPTAAPAPASSGLLMAGII